MESLLRQERQSRWETDVLLQLPVRTKKDLLFLPAADRRVYLRKEKRIGMFSGIYSVRHTKDQVQKSEKLRRLLHLIFRQIGNNQ